MNKLKELNFYVPFLHWVVVIALTSLFLIVVGLKVPIVISVASFFVLSWFLLALF